MPGRLFLNRVSQDNSAREQATWRTGLNLAPGDEITVRTPTGDEAMRWGLILQGRVNARGRPVLEQLINIRSETAFEKSAFTDLKRGAVPIDGWYEWTGKPRSKQAWRISRVDGALIWVAALFDIWTAPGGRRIPQVATLTRAPNADVVDIHDRMGVLLHEVQVASWLDGSADLPPDPWPAGLLQAEAVPDPGQISP